MMPTWKKIQFQNSNSPLMEHLNFLHDHNFMVMTMITIMILIMMMILLMNSFSNRFFSENQEIEYFWTSMPAFILMFLALPSMKILYMTEEYISPTMTIKISGHQWYWSYEYSELKDISFDSYMTESNKIRLLDTSNHLIVPNKTAIRLLILSDDVIHSWTIPSLGIKIDAIPGRMNQLITYIDRVGMFTGQCSEICGTNHSFMPITISSITLKTFMKSIMLM